MKITIVGIGYVGFSLAVLLAQHNEVVAVDTDIEKINLVNQKKSPIIDREIDEFLRTKNLCLKATADMEEACKDAEIVIVAAPTNYDNEKKHFDTFAVEDIIKNVKGVNPDAVVVIKSTVPVGFTEMIIKKYDYPNIFFSPEFLREGRALYDNLYPSRIVVGFSEKNKDVAQMAEKFIRIMIEAAAKADIQVVATNSTEAEAIKLFANTYLALRVAFFNELDTYAEVCNLDTKAIIEGVCADPRIGNQYNNPSFGYGGYCLPKDTKQLRANYTDVPQNLISAIIDANATRKQFIAEQIIKKSPQTVGIYRLTMKAGSDNFRESSIHDIIKHLKENGIEIAIYEPSITGETFEGGKIFNDIGKFKEVSDIIIANRYNVEIEDVLGKVYTRDLYFRD